MESRIEKDREELRNFEGHGYPSVGDSPKIQQIGAFSYFILARSKDC